MGFGIRVSSQAHTHTSLAVSWQPQLEPCVLNPVKPVNAVNSVNLQKPIQRPVQQCCVPRKLHDRRCGLGQGQAGSSKSSQQGHSQQQEPSHCNMGGQDKRDGGPDTNQHLNKKAGNI